MKDADGNTIYVENNLKCLCRAIKEITASTEYKLTCRYPGAPTFNYEAYLMHTSAGRYLRPNNTMLKTGAFITSVKAYSAVSTANANDYVLSQYAGGILVIEGTNFGMLKTDNQIKITGEAMTGIYEADPISLTPDPDTTLPADASVVDTYAEKLIVRMPVRGIASIVDTEVEILVFLNAAEDATCQEDLTGITDKTT
jgi:hypothetical protein